MDPLAGLEAQVAANTTVEGSAVTLMNQLSAIIEANKTNPTKLQEISDRLKSSADALAAAIVANTPVP